MNHLIKEIKNAVRSVLPIYFFIIIFFYKIFSLTQLVDFSLSTIFVVLGIAMFTFGAENSMTPIGREIGRGLTRQGKRLPLYLAVFIFGVLITTSEPDLSVLSKQTASVFDSKLLIMLISVAVGLFLVFAILKIIYKVSLVTLLSYFYLLVFALLSIVVLCSKESFIALCFDSGGVTTGPMTVPFILALGTGIASVLSKKSERDASFGFIAFSSIGPVIVMIIMSIFSRGDINYGIERIVEHSGYFIPFVSVFLVKAKEVLFAISMILISYLAVNYLYLHAPKEKIKSMLGSLAICCVGLSFFLSAVELSYMNIGRIIGGNLSTLGVEKLLFFGFLFGAFTVIAEPAIFVLVERVEEVTNGLVKKKSMLFALAIAVGFAVSISFLRIEYKINILYILLPCYLVCFLLSFFVPKLYSAVAFDAGGVASGPLTSSFILPMTLGICASKCTEAEILSYGFGVVALVALSPIMFVEAFGLIFFIKNKMRVNAEVKKVLKKNDNMTISFAMDGKKRLEKLYLMIAVLPRGKREIIEDLLKSYRVNTCYNTLAKGSFDKTLTRDAVFCLVRADMVKDVLFAIEDKCITLNAKNYMIYTVSVDRMTGIANYMMFSDGGKV